MERQLWGLNPLGYHLVNVLLHAGCAILLWLVLVRLRMSTAWCCAIVFAVHPVHVESVAWVTELKNVLSGCLYMLALLCYLRFQQLHEAGRSARRQHLGWWLLAAFIFWLGAAQQECDGLFAGCHSAHPLVAEGAIVHRDWLPTLPLFGLAFLSSRITVLVEQHVVGASEVLNWTWPQRLLIGGRAFWVYIGKLIWPSNLCFFYPKWEVDAGDPKQYVFPAFVVLVVAVLFFGRTRFGRGPVTAVLYFGGTLFPVLGFFNVYPFRYSYVADHFQYLASIGIIVLVLEAGRSLLLRGLGKQGPTNRVRDVLSLLSFVAVGGIAAVLGGLTWSQCWVYRDHETLWRRHDCQESGELTPPTRT